MTDKREIALLLATAALAAVAAGCGGDADSDNGDPSGQVQNATSGDTQSSTAPQPISTSSISKARYIQRARKICDRTEPRMTTAIIAYEKKHGLKPGETANDRVAVLIRLISIPVLQSRADELRSLGAPRGDKDEIEAIVDAMQENIDGMAGRRISTFEQFGREFQSSDELIAKYGLDGCVFSSLNEV